MSKKKTSTRKTDPDDDGWQDFDTQLVAMVEEHGPGETLERAARVVDKLVQWMYERQQDILHSRLSILRNSVRVGDKALGTPAGQASLLWQIDDTAKCVGLDWKPAPLNGEARKVYQELKQAEHGGGVQ